MSLLRLLLPLLPALLDLLPEGPRAARHLGRRAALRVALVLLPVVLLLAAAVFAVAAAYMALAEALSPAAAAGIVALALALLAALEAVLVIALDRAAETKRARAAQEARDGLLNSLQDAGRLVAAKPLPAVLLAAAAGTVVALLARRR